MSQSPSSACHLLKSKDSFVEKKAPQSPVSSSSSTSEIQRNDKASKKATAPITKTKFPARKPVIRRKGVAQIVKAPAKRPREVTVITSTAIGSKRKRSSPSTDSSDEDEARENSSGSAAKRRKQVHKTDSMVKVDEEARLREAEEDAALDEAEKKITKRKELATAKVSGAKRDATRKKPKPQQKTWKKESYDED